MEDMLLTTVCVLSPLLQLTLGALQFQHPEDLPETKYDFIIVGGGTAGLVVGKRLGEVQGVNILVIEAGPSNDEVFETNIPGLANEVEFQTRLDGWNYSSTPQVNANGRVIAYPRAKILGGCSSHNSMVYTRGSRDDYDRLASTMGDENLSWNNILQYILKAERWSSPNDPNLPETNHFNISNHNTDGILGVTAPYYNHPINDVLLETIQNISEEFPFLLDLNNGRPIGMGWIQTTISHGTRSSSATSYLPHTGDNVHVLLNTLVTRILPIGNSHERDFRKVEFATSPSGPKRTLIAGREVILSGGFINSPQVLLNSGIGPADELRALGITPFFNNPSVGKNLSDQVGISFGYSTKLNVTEFNMTAARAQWDKDHTGLLAVISLVPLFSWIRIPDNAAPFKNGAPDPTGGPNAPHIEMAVFSITGQDETGTATKRSISSNNTLSMGIINLHSISRGSITLATTSPFDPPLIDLGLLSAELDTSIIVEGVRSAQRVFSSPPISESVSDINIPRSNPNGTLTDEDIREYTTFQAIHAGHGVGTCSMAPHGADWGVVDPDFKVRGVNGLRIVDASVIAFLPSGHTQAAVYAIAEWASDVIKKSQGKKN